MASACRAGSLRGPPVPAPVIRLLSRAGLRTFFSGASHRTLRASLGTGAAAGPRPPLGRRGGTPSAWLGANRLRPEKVCGPVSYRGPAKGFAGPRGPARRPNQELFLSAPRARLPQAVKGKMHGGSAAALDRPWWRLLLPRKGAPIVGACAGPPSQKKRAAPRGRGARRPKAAQRSARAPPAYRFPFLRSGPFRSPLPPPRPGSPRWELPGSAKLKQGPLQTRRRAPSRPAASGHTPDFCIWPGSLATLAQRLSPRQG